MHGRFRCVAAVLACVLAWCGGDGSAQTLNPTKRDLVYAVAGHRELRLDLYQPTPQAAARSPFAVPDVGQPLVVWVHGGAWVHGDKKDVPITWLTRQGVAVASVEYRLLGEAMFPAPIYDVQAALRYLRGNAQMLGIDPDRVVLSGASAGGHLASLVALTAHDPVKDGGLGDYTDQPLAVDGVIDAFGPTDMNAIIDSLKRQERFSESREGKAVIAISQAMPGFFDGLSPVKQVTPDAPPFLIMHGENDPIVPVEQSLWLHDALQEAGVESTLEVIPGARHGGGVFTDQRRKALLVRFLRSLWTTPPAEAYSSR